MHPMRSPIKPMAVANGSSSLMDTGLAFNHHEALYTPCKSETMKSILAPIEFLAIALVIFFKLGKESCYSPDGIFILTEDYHGE